MWLIFMNDNETKFKMNPKFYYMSIIILTLFLLKFCNIPGASSENNNIYGNWIWLESVGGFAGHRLTPGTENFSIYVK